MKIGGFLENTLSDYPGHVAAMVFTQGCNFRCPFCHNPDLISRKTSTSYEIKDVLVFLDKRKSLLDALVISGGEPLMHPDLPQFIRFVRELGLKVKLDTNGSFPQLLKVVIDQNLIDYVAMDIKTIPEQYSELTGADTSFDPIQNSIDLLINGTLPFEFRTTVIPRFHTLDTIKSIARIIQGAPRYVLQGFNNQRTLHPDFLSEPMPTPNTLLTMQSAAQDYISQVIIKQ